MQPVRPFQAGATTIKEVSGAPIPTVASPPSRFVSQTPSYVGLPAINAVMGTTSPTGSSPALMAPFPSLGQRVDAYSLAQSPLGQRVATPAANDPLLGNQIGNYLIQKRIGKGGFGAVYLAKHLFIQQNVAIKVLHVDRQTEPEIIERFKREAHTLAQLTHKHIVQLSDFGMIPNQGFYLAMEYLEGRNLGTILRKKYRFSLTQIKFMFEQLCDVLQYVHAMGIVHRDLKPGNVFLLKSSPEEAPQIRLIDFGIATLNQELGSLTGTGTYLGTAKYISPEQGRGDKQLDGRADLYSAAVMLYRLLTGHLPFDGEQPITVLYNQIHAPPPALKALAPDQEWHPTLEAFMQKAMAKDRDERPQSGHEFYRGLAEAIDAQLAMAPLAATTINRPGSPVARRQSTQTPQVQAPAEAASPAPAPAPAAPSAAPNGANAEAPAPSKPEARANDAVEGANAAQPSKTPAATSPTGTTTAPLAPSASSSPPVFKPSSSSLPAASPYTEGDQELQKTIAGEPPPHLTPAIQGTPYDLDGGDTIFGDAPPTLPTATRLAAPSAPPNKVLEATSLLDETQSTMVGGAPPSLGVVRSSRVTGLASAPSPQEPAEATQASDAQEGAEPTPQDEHPLAQTQESRPDQSRLNALATQASEEAETSPAPDATAAPEEANEADEEAPELELSEDDREDEPASLPYEEGDDELGGETIQRPMEGTLKSALSGSPPPPPAKARPPAPPAGALPTGQLEPVEANATGPAPIAPPAPFPAAPGGLMPPGQDHKRRAGDFPLPPGPMGSLPEPSMQAGGDAMASEGAKATAAQPSEAPAAGASSSAASDDPLGWFEEFGEEHGLHDDEDDDPFAASRTRGKMLMGVGVLFVLIALLWWSMSGPSTKPQPTKKQPAQRTKRQAPPPQPQPAARPNARQDAPVLDASSGSIPPPPIPGLPTQPDQAAPEPPPQEPDQTKKATPVAARRRVFRRRRRYIRRRRVKRRTKRRKPPVDTRKPPPRDRDPYGINPFKQ